MVEADARLAEVLADAEHTRRELDRKNYHLRTLTEAARDFARLTHPRKILDTFLLYAMGAVGATCGVAVLGTACSRGALVASSGLSPGEMEAMESNGPRLLDHSLFERPVADASTMPQAHLALANTLDHAALLPGRVVVVVSGYVDAEYGCILGLGPKLSAEEYSEDDGEVLVNLSNVLLASLRSTLASSRFHQLNAALRKKNEDLELALEQAEKARRDLNRRLFHLKLLNEMTGELAGLCEARDILENTLLLLLAAFSVKSGVAVVLSRERREAACVFRGVEPRVLDAAEAEKLLFSCFDAAESRQLTPMSISRLEDPSAVLSQHGILMDATMACFFVIDEDSMGVVALGPTFTGEPPALDDRHLLSTYLANTMLFLKNAFSLATITGLNQDLARRNEELQKTIADLTEARGAIHMLESIGKAMRAAVHGEMERIGKPSLLDAALIVAVAMAIAVVFNFTNPNAIALLPPDFNGPAAPSVTVAEAASGGPEQVFVDARPASMYERGHIPDAINVPPWLFDLVYLMRLAAL